MTNELSKQDRIALENHMKALNERQAEPVVVPAGEKSLPEQELALLRAAMAKPKAPVRLSTAALAARDKARTAADKEKRRHENQILRQRHIKSEIERHSTLPVIPSAQAAREDGQFQGDYDAFLVASGLVKLSVEVPADASPQERVAWQLVPAFLREYGRRYPHMTPKLLVAAWDKVMTTQTASGQLMVDPTELRLVVEHMARETGEQFNPKMMAAHALRFRIEIQNGQRKAPTMDYPGRFFDFHTSVAETPAFTPTVWVEQVDFPTLFPASAIDDETLDLINRVIHYRYMTERTQGFTAPMARFLAEVLLTTVICRLNSDEPLTQSEIFHTAYRFSHRYIKEQRPHESKHANDEPTSEIYSLQDEQDDE